MQHSTRLALAGRDTDTAFNSIAPPIYQTAVFRFDDVGSDKGYDYTRSGNPTRSALEESLAALEGGADAVALSSGMAAIATALHVLDAGAHIICSHDCYGGTERLLTHLASQAKIDVDYVDLRDSAALRAALRPETKALWVETPSNPLLRVVDLGYLADLAQEQGLLLIVDNTFLSPLLQKPLQYGADIVVHSTTKYLNGHSDVIGGALVAATDELAEKIRFLANAYGTGAAPFDCWLVLRGMKTLPLRMRRHEANALAVARFLEDHPAVERVLYPGLASHDDHELACRQQEGFGGILSFTVTGDQAAAEHVLRTVRVFNLAVSVGGVESLIEHPATMSHASMRPEQRLLAGISDNLIRLSVGIEDIEDLIADLRHALASLPQALNEVIEDVSVWEL